MPVLLFQLVFWSHRVQSLPISQIMCIWLKRLLLTSKKYGSDVIFFFSFFWKGAHLMLYVSNKGGGDTTGGIAYLSEVCNNSNRNHRKQSINEYQSSAVATGWVS